MEAARRGREVRPAKWDAWGADRRGAGPAWADGPCCGLPWARRRDAAVPDKEVDLDEATAGAAARRDAAGPGPAWATAAVDLTDLTWRRDRDVAARPDARPAVRREFWVLEGRRSAASARGEPEGRPDEAVRERPGTEWDAAGAQWERRDEPWAAQPDAKPPEPSRLAAAAPEALPVEVDEAPKAPGRDAARRPAEWVGAAAEWVGREESKRARRRAARMESQRAGEARPVARPDAARLREAVSAYRETRWADATAARVAGYPRRFFLPERAARPELRLYFRGRARARQVQAEQRGRVSRGAAQRVRFPPRRRVRPHGLPQKRRRRWDERKAAARRIRLCSIGAVGRLYRRRSSSSG